MGIVYDDAVMISQSEREEEPSVITVNCPDKTGLGCDLCRIILFFGLTVVRIDVSTDGKWCYIVFWVVGRPSTRWSLLKKRLMGVCPSFLLANGISYDRPELSPPKPPDMYLLKFCCFDRRGLLHDVTGVLCELELTIKRVKVSTTPDGKVMDLFFITDSRELLHTKKRKEDTCDHLKAVLGDGTISCSIERVGPEITSSSQGPSFLSCGITEDMLLNPNEDDPISFKCPSITMDNLLSPSHTLVQIVCRDHKGLLYDVMRTLKDCDIQVSYGRLTRKGSTECELDLFIMQVDGKKIVDPNRQNSLSTRLQVELSRPLRLLLINRGPDTELLVANPIELSGKGRPMVFHDITLALKTLNRPIFSAEIARHGIGGREWEIYRVLLDEGENGSASKKEIEETVWRMLMSWE
ncbi:ACT domain-containing protein ACR10-like isoform X1 [Salvia splendens]|uniref:ACT domain-containing protein ACR10-like isoform X1 n=1 Tax=Salvia splendens TaxID=180675 RepID=UPI001C266D59|nr:ACT domain-containing protein ACR10-like isoform X1 [Salvia splendens]